MNKGLQALENIKKVSIIFHGEFDLYNEIIEIETELKALEIIKKKKVDTLLLFRCFEFDNLYGYPHFEMYNQELYTQNITKEDYDLLKEVLGND